MLKPTEARLEEARKKARDLLVQGRAKDAEIVKEREKAFAAQAEKASRLRALRLAREAADQAAEPVAKPAKKPAAKRVVVRARSAR
ncbi:MAG TPA: hypothetical protein VGM59_02265 [Dongiaceae bacterium]|jgi:hypothetical protein